MADKDKYYRIVEGMLYNYKKLIIEIKDIDLDIQDIEDDYTGCNAITYEERAAPTNKFNSSVENEMIYKNGKTEQLKRMKRRLERKVERVDNMLSILTNEEYRLIELRYFQRLQFKEISKMLDKSDIYLISFRKKIIKEKLVPLVKSKLYIIKN